MMTTESAPALGGILVMPPSETIRRTTIHKSCVACQRPLVELAVTCGAC